MLDLLECLDGVGQLRLGPFFEGLSESADDLIADRNDEAAAFGGEGEGEAAASG